MSFEHIPENLKVLPHWVNWGVVGSNPGDKKWKIPYNADTAQPAKAGIPETWTTFETAYEGVTANCYAGIGFEFNGSGSVGVDFDHCFHDGQLDPWVSQWVERFGSYTEISPSGQGLHILCRGSLPGKAVKRPRAELYDRGRYFTVTGNVYGEARPLADAQEAINALYEELTAETKKVQDKPTQRRIANSLPPTGEDYLKIGLERDLVFASLWQGNRPYNDESANDMAFMNRLAFWCNCDGDAMAAAFLSSPYVAGKDPEHQKKAMEREDYLNRTIEKAIDDCPKTAAEANAEYQVEQVQKDFGEYTLSILERTTPDIVCLDSVETSTVKWLWYPYIPFGKITLMEADPGTGKTFLCLAIAAVISKGGHFFGETLEIERSPATVIYQTEEDGLADTIKPRLESMNPDFSKIFISQKSL